MLAFYSDFKDKNPVFVENMHQFGQHFLTDEDAPAPDPLIADQTCQNRAVVLAVLMQKKQRGQVLREAEISFIGASVFLTAVSVQNLDPFGLRVSMKTLSESEIVKVDGLKRVCLWRLKEKNSRNNRISESIGG